MARFRARARARTRRASPRRGFFKARTRSRSKGAGVKLIQFDAMIYGGVRGYISNMLAPIMSKIPLGNIADEVVMGGVNYLVAKNTSGMIKDIALKGLVIENARLGEAVVTGGLGNLLPSGSGASNAAYEY
jgi:hypothetical protein